MHINYVSVREEDLKYLKFKQRLIIISIGVLWYFKVADDIHFKSFINHVEKCVKKP